jgi:hypothetical protein
MPDYPDGMAMQRTANPRCNIGPDEVARRRRAAIALTITTAVVAALLIALDTPTLIRLLVWPVATAAAVTWLQVVHKFCVAFGALGIENLGAIGQEAPVDATQRAADRRRMVQLVLEGSLIGAIVTLALVVLPV